MSKDLNTTEIDDGVILPEDGIIDKSYVQEQLARVDLFSASMLAYGRGKIFFLARNNLGSQAYEQLVQDVGFSLDSANDYVTYLELKPVIEAIRSKYYIALSLAASKVIPSSIEEALAICDIVVAKYGKITRDNIVKAIETTGQSVKKMSDAAISVETLKKKALHDWMLNEHGLSDDDIYQASQLHPEGLKEFSEKMTQAYFLLEDWKVFYNIIAPAVKESDNSKALRFLSDMQDASGSIEEYLAAEQANQKLIALKSTFEQEVYPKISFDKETSDA